MITSNDFTATVKTNRWYLLIAIPAILAQLIIFKTGYPFASYFFTDSFGYIYAAINNMDAGTWPVGYSKFLRVFNTFIHTDTGLVCFQYLFLQAAGLYFLFTLLHFFRPSRIIANVLFIFLVFNPVFLYLANSVSSDALFIGGSFLWLSQLIRMIRRPSLRRSCLHAILLALLFTFRYNAIYYYPLVSLLAILLSSPARRISPTGHITHLTRLAQKTLLSQRAIAIALPALLLLAFIYYTGNSVKQMTGTRKFSPFGGWQMANNALYLVRNAHDLPPAPARFAGLDSQIRHYFDTAKQERTLFDASYPGIYFLWSQQGPLAAYVNQQRKKDTTVPYFTSWTAASQQYTGYATWLIGQHPAAFVQHFVWPNTIRYIFPPLEFMGRYNSNMDTVDQMAKFWFHYKSNRVKAFSKDFQAFLLAGFPILNLVTNLFFLLIVLLFAFTKSAWKITSVPAGHLPPPTSAVAQAPSSSPAFARYIAVVFALWLLHFAFSVVAAPVVLRYQVFLLTICLSFSLLIVEQLVRSDKTIKNIPTTTT